MSQPTTRRPVSIRPRTFVTILAALGLLAGVLLLFLPVSTSPHGVAYGCGSPVVVPRDGVAFDDVMAGARQGDAVPYAALQAGCADARDTRGVLAWTLLGIGVVALAGTRFVRW